MLWGFWEDGLPGNWNSIFTSPFSNLETIYHHRFVINWYYLRGYSWKLWITLFVKFTQYTWRLTNIIDEFWYVMCRLKHCCECYILSRDHSLSSIFFISHELRQCFNLYREFPLVIPRHCSLWTLVNKLRQPNISLTLVQCLTQHKV